MTIPVYHDRVREVTTSSGTADFALNGADSGGYVTFSSKYANGDPVPYCALYQNQWETGVGTYNSSTNKITRPTTTLENSSGGTGQITFSGSPVVFCSAVAAVVNVVSGRNRIINGDMQIDQRNVGTSQTIVAGAAVAYTVDRWYASCTGANATGQQITGTFPYASAYKITGLLANTATLFGQRVESKNCFDLVSQNVVVQAQIASSAGATVTWTAFYANSADTFSSKTQIATGTIVTTSTPTVYSFGFNAGANAANGICIEFTTGALVATQTVQYSGVQLESGYLASPFERVNFTDMMLRCQRYYCKTFNQSVVPAQSSGGGSIFAPAAYTSGSQLSYIANWKFPALMRTTPTVTTYATQNAASGWSTGGAVNISASVQPSDSGTLVFNSANAVGGDYASTSMSAVAEL